MALKMWLLFVVEYSAEGKPRLTYYRAYRSRSGVMGRLRSEKSKRGTKGMERMEIPGGVAYVWPFVSITVETRQLEAVNADGLAGWILGGSYAANQAD